MIFHFCLYGFLKNQRYFEPFFLLAMLEKGLSYFAVGLLVGFRGLAVNLLEVPTGVIADAFGRRASMMASFSAYCCSFFLFGAGRSLPVLFLAMALFSLGEAFRTGTHKAIILDWLQSQGRLAERNRVYGITRSWSKYGSALSAVIAAGLVFLSGDYSRIFYFSIVPYLLGLVNFLFYPADARSRRRAMGTAAFRTFFKDAMAHTFRRRSLRNLLAEAALFEGPYKVTKDYIQPLLKAAALGLPLFAAWNDARRSALLVGAVFVVLYLLEGAASRYSARFIEHWPGRERQGVPRLWMMNLGACIVLALAFQARFYVLAVVGFLALAVLQNLWRPNMIGRLTAAAAPEYRATVLSVNSQADSLVMLAVAPVVGKLVDLAHGNAWAAGAVPALFAVAGLFLARRNLGIAGPAAESAG